MQDFRLYIEFIARGIEAVGVLIIAIGAAVALYHFVFPFGQNARRSYRALRHELGKAILLGLEVLVAADIIATVVTEPSLERVLTLGLIVLIRTFLSLSLQVELEGRFPWQPRKPETDQPL